MITLARITMARSHHWLIVVASLLPLCIGCTSVESTMVTRDETNQAWERHNCLNGIPITLKVPTHVKLYVFHKHYLGLTPPNGTEKQRVVPVDLDVVVRDFAYELMYTDKVFVVDFARPAAGSSKLRVNMTEEQYIDEIQHEIVDETINDVTGLLGAFTGPKGLVASTASGPDKPALDEIKSLVAVGIFEIDSPDFEQKVKDFLNCHVNKAHDAWVVPPSVSVPRVGIPATDNTAAPYPEVPFCPEEGACPGDCLGIESILPNELAPGIAP